MNPKDEFCDTSQPFPMVLLQDTYTRPRAYRGKSSYFPKHLVKMKVAVLNVLKNKYAPLSVMAIQLDTGINAGDLSGGQRGDQWRYLEKTNEKWKTTERFYLGESYNAIKSKEACLIGHTEHRWLQRAAAPFYLGF